MAYNAQAFHESGIGKGIQHLKNTLPAESAGHEHVADFPAEIILRHHGQRVADYGSGYQGGKSADPHQQGSAYDSHCMQRDGRGDADKYADGYTDGQGAGIAPEPNEFEQEITDCPKRMETHDQCSLGLE